MGVDPITLTLIAATVMTAGSQVYNGVKQNQIAETNAELSRRQGNQEQDAAIAQAEKIRRAGKATAGQATAAAAASGVSIGDGTPVRINEQIYNDSENDAYSTLLTGSRRKQSADDQAGVLINEGRAARTSGYLNAGATVLSAGSSYGKWKTSQSKG